MSTRVRFYESLLEDPFLDGIDDWPDNHVCWLVEAFWNLVKGRINCSKTAKKFLTKNADAMLKIADQRDYDKARNVLRRYAPPLIPVALTQVIIHIRGKKMNDREYNALLRQYSESDGESSEGEDDGGNEEDEEGEEEEENEEGNEDDDSNEEDESED